METEMRLKLTWNLGEVAGTVSTDGPGTIRTCV
jgi:hypothetical protein